jgi:hypothetical protein
MLSRDESGILGNDFNPYAAPESAAGPPPLILGPASADAEAIRRRYLRHEAAVKSIGSLHYLGAGVGILVILVASALLIRTSRSDPRVSLFALLIAVYTFATAVNFILGRGIRSLNGWARWTDVVFLAIGSLGSLLTLVGGLVSAYSVVVGSSIGLTIQTYMLYLLIGPRSSIIFSPDYRAIVEKTPQVTCRTSVFVKILAGLLLVLGVFGFLAVLLGP